MSVRIVSLLIPTYIRPAHQGQTPVRYGQKVTAKFEAELFKLAPWMTKQETQELYTDPVHGKLWAPRIRYDVLTAMDESLSQIIALALSSFSVPAITVTTGLDCDTFNAETVEELAAGLHAWSEE